MKMEPREILATRDPREQKYIHIFLYSPSLDGDVMFVQGMMGDLGEDGEQGVNGDPGSIGLLVRLDENTM